MSKRQESRIKEKRTHVGESEGGIQKGKPKVLAFLVGKVLLWYGIRENLLCGYYISKAGGLQLFPE